MSVLRKMEAAIICSVPTANITSAGYVWELGNHIVYVVVPSMEKIRTFSVIGHVKLSGCKSTTMKEYVGFFL
jgi:hypothetical protein